MPRRRWRLKDRRTPLTPAMCLYLERGLGALLAMPKDSRPLGWQEAMFFTHSGDRVAAWREYGGELAAAWIGQHPGSRLWAWWQYTAAAPRTCLEGGDFVWKPGVGDWRWKDGFGLPGRPQVRRPGAEPARLLFESQATYLQRLGSFLPGEAEQLTPEDFEPEIVEIPEEPLLDRLGRHWIPARPAGASTNGAAKRSRH